MNIGQLDGQPLALQIFNGMTAESICVNERWAKDQLFRCVCFAGGQIKSTPSIAWRTLCFNPRPPCGGRQSYGTVASVIGLFQSTSSVWRTTHPAALSLGPEPISIHVLRVEDDLRLSSLALRALAFQSTSSVWRTTCGGRHRVKYGQIFQSTSSVWRTTCGIMLLLLSRRYFNPRPPCGGRRPTCPARL